MYIVFQILYHLGPYVDRVFLTRYVLAGRLPHILHIGTFEYGDFKYHIRGDTGYFEEGKNIDVVGPHLHTKHEVQGKFYLAYSIRDYLHPVLNIRYLRTGADIVTGPMGTFEYGNTDLISPSQKIINVLFFSNYHLDSYFYGDRIEINIQFMIRYDLWHLAERELELRYRIEPSGAGERTLRLRYQIRRFIIKTASFQYNITAPFATFSMQKSVRGFDWGDDFRDFDDFRWHIAPGRDRAQIISAGGISLSHGTDPAFIFSHVTGEDWALQAKLDYSPIIPRDQGGLVVWGETDQQVGLFWGETHPDEIYHPYMRIIGRRGIIEGWSSADNETWVFRGRQRLSGVSGAGFALLHDIGEDLIVRSADWFRGGHVKITGLYPGMKASVYRTDSGHARLVSRGISQYRGQEVYLPIGSEPWPFEGYITLYGFEGSLVAQTENHDINGGDEWFFFYPFHLRLNGIDLPKKKAHPAGSIEGPNRLEVVNQYDQPSPRLRLSFRHKDGSHPDVLIAPPDERGLPGVQRFRAVEVPPIAPGGTAPYWLINLPSQIRSDEESAYEYDIILEIM